MIKKYGNGLKWGILGIILQIISGGVYHASLFMVGTTLLIFGCTYYALAKNRHPGWGLLGILSLLGVVFLASLKDESSDKESISQEYVEKIPLILLIGFILVLGIQNPWWQKEIPEIAIERIEEYGKGGTVKLEIEPQDDVIGPTQESVKVDYEIEILRDVTFLDTPSLEGIVVTFRYNDGSEGGSHSGEGHSYLEHLRGKRLKKGETIKGTVEVGIDRQDTRITGILIQLSFFALDPNTNLLLQTNSNVVECHVKLKRFLDYLDLFS